jgi:hypothetical protein
LKTYLTSLGFFEQVIAAPSMKAALEAWGADSNLFHQGAAKESTDPDVIAAAMENPGIVLKRPVGSDVPFGEHADLPKSFGEDRPSKTARRSADRKAKVTSARPDKATDRKAAQAYDRERQRREREEAKEEAARQKQRERRQKAIDNVQSAFDKAEAEHERRGSALRAALETIEKKLQAEDTDWEEKEGRLKGQLKRARD